MGEEEERSGGGVDERSGVGQLGRGVRTKGRVTEHRSCGCRTVVREQLDALPRAQRRSYQRDCHSKMHQDSLSFLSISYSTGRPWQSQPKRRVTWWPVPLAYRVTMSCTAARGADECAGISEQV